LSLGSSYICTSTKDLQTQYSKDFPYIRMAKGKNNFPCLLKHDFIDNGVYRCGICASDNPNECFHTTVEYGNCMSNEFFKGDGCKYRTFLKDYKLINERTKEEEIFIDTGAKQNYKKQYTDWSAITDLKIKREWKPCEYFNQLNIALTSSHSIFNYSIFLAFLPYNKSLQKRELLVLDEGHLLETEIVKFRGLSISKRKWKKYVPNLEIIDYGYDDIERWIDFLIDLETKMLVAIGNSSAVELLALERNIKYNYCIEDSKKIARTKTENKKKKIVSHHVGLMGGCKMLSQSRRIN